jgi:putative membrane protein
MTIQAYEHAMHVRKFASSVAVLAGAACPTLAFAHGAEVHEATSFWLIWNFSPEILIGLGLALAIYVRGALRGPRPTAMRAMAFVAGLTALFAALISPIEPLADHIFAVHQVEHMLLRTLGPMLIFLAQPQAALMRGLPGGLRRGVAGSIVSNGPVQLLFGTLRQPVIATILFLAASYFWMLPRFHDLAILDMPVHYLWHMSLLAAGLIWFSVIFDQRRPPHGPALGTRLAMFVAAALGNIVLGAFLTFKGQAIYSAYTTLGHFWHVPMAMDERTGGAIMWMPGTMMFAVCAGIVLYRWAREEERTDALRMRDLRPAPTRAATANGRLAIGLGLFAITMLVLAFAVAATIHSVDEHRAAGAGHLIP